MEVVEHIHPKYVCNLMKTFANHTDCVVLSAAQPGQGGEGHFNEQTAEYWIERFDDCGFKQDSEKTAIMQRVDEAFSQNVLVFIR
jgi:hypothetical protein